MAPNRLWLYFVDNNAKRAKFGVYLPEGTEIANAVAFAQSLGQAAQALSSASLVGGEYEVLLEFPGANPPAIDSNVYTRLVAVFSSESERYVTTVPSPGALPYDLGGSLRAIRLGYEAAQVSGLLSALQSLMAGNVTPWGSPAPSSFVVAGISRGVL